VDARDLKSFNILLAGVAPSAAVLKSFKKFQ
jgi:hypothetical protein